MSSAAEPVPVSNPPAASSIDPNPPAESAPAADDVKVADTTKPNEVPSNDKPPSVDTIRKVEDYTVFDNKGQKHSFKSIYSGSDSTERVLVIFIRHFFCGVSFPMFVFLWKPFLTISSRAVKNTFVHSLHHFSQKSYSNCPSPPLSPSSAAVIMA